MVNRAILVGNSQYKSLKVLPCCANDLVAMKELLESTGKYSEIGIVENSDADELKSRIRAAVDTDQQTEELFFYFTGHGCQRDEEFYYCATNFDSERPNETGLSSDELHILLRQADSNLVVKVIDACNSGVSLIKADDEHQLQPPKKYGFNNLIQISSCLQSQNALAGESLSVFTEAFRAAALRKNEGIVYYTDIINTLRDESLQNHDQTPFFISQGTGREQFVDDAKSLDSLRAKLAKEDKLPSQLEEEDQQVPAAPRSVQTLLEEAEENMATPEKIEFFVNTFFDDLIEEVSKDEFSEFFDLEVSEHPDFDEPTSEAHIIRVLARESRSDEFVTARIRREKAQNPLQASTAAIWGILGGDQSYRETYELHLNCEMQRAQLKITLTPKYHSLKRIVVVVTCAPSLENCYIFEIGTEHSLISFGKFNAEGVEVVRRWYKLPWTKNTSGVVRRVTSKISEIVREHLERTEQRLTGN